MIEACYSPLAPEPRMLSRSMLALACCATTAASAELTVLSWNVESDGAEPAVIARQLGELPYATIFALQEVDGDDIGRYGNAIREAHGKSYRYFASWTGGSDRLLVAFDESRLTLMEWRELFLFGEHEMNDWRHRSPLVCLFEERATGEQFYFVTVHLARGDAKLRTSQAAGLAAWASDTDSPIIAAGDFNFDYEFATRRGNPAMVAMERGGVWRWAEPDKLVDTNWADRDGDGIDNYPESCLDFAFYAGLPDGWQVTSEVIVRPGDFPDDDTTSDHRPIYVAVSTGGTAKNAFGAAAAESPIWPPASSLTTGPSQPAAAGTAHWLNTTTGVRHNAGCKNFKNTKRGRLCTASEGKPCGMCGG